MQKYTRRADTSTGNFVKAYSRINPIFSTKPIMRLVYIMSRKLEPSNILTWAIWASLITVEEAAPHIRR